MRAKEPKVPYEKSFRAKSRRHGKSFGNYAEGILIYLKNIVLSSKNDAGLVGVQIGNFEMAKFYHLSSHYC